MYYELSLSTANGSINVILTDISIINGCVHGTLVGKPAGWDENGIIKFYACTHRDYFAGGSAFTLTEYKGELK